MLQTDVFIKENDAFWVPGIHTEIANIRASIVAVLADGAALWPGNPSRDAKRRVFTLFSNSGLLREGLR